MRPRNWRALAASAAIGGRRYAAGDGVLDDHPIDVEVGHIKLIMQDAEPVENLFSKGALPMLCLRIAVEDATA